MIISHLKERINSAFTDLIFDPVKHLYHVGNESLPSVSSLVEGHCEKVDFEMLAIRSAKKLGVPVLELKTQWKKTNKDACDLGIDTHDFLEKYTGLETPDNPWKIAGIKFFKDTSDRYEIVEREIRMYSRRYKYAGTADLLLWDKIDECLILADYKTNKDLFKAYQYLKSPFNSMESSAYNKYQIQLCYYQIMLEEIGIRIGKRLLIYLKYDETYKTYDLYNLIPELLEGLENKQKILW